MCKIRSVFEKSDKLERRIEKVIQYDMQSSKQLRNEVSEYIVTDNIRYNFEHLLDLIDRGIEEGSNEIGVWVSGFYGSGKSSFTKYFGFALDTDRTIAGTPFLKYLQDRFESKQIQQRLATVAKRHDPTVLMLDLASDQLGDSTTEISTVLYAKVMQWAGYSQDRKIAYLELKLEQDGKKEAFEKRMAEHAGVAWEDVKDDPLAANRYASDLACEFYPDLFRDEDALMQLNVDEQINEKDRAKNMIDLIQRVSRKQNIIFILDEVGQYVAARDSLILNLQGLAQNLKKLGGGKVWIIATAQQTLTEDDPRARLNSAKLFKLKDRFPVGIDLEASDIREICYKRLLGKSLEGKDTLEAMYDEHGQKLRTHTRLEDASIYQAESLDKQKFQRLYPFLPQHFTLLLEMLGRLSSSTGGTGLRSAIKVVQDVLVNPDSLRDGTDVLSSRPLGALATTVTFYDTLRRDIDRSYRHIVKGVSDVVTAYGADSMEARVAKTVAILQVVENCPARRSNVAALMHPAVDAPSQKETVDATVETLLDDQSIRINEVDDALQFLSEKVNDLEDQRRKLVPNIREQQRIQNDKIRQIFTPTPSASLHGSKSVKTGLKLNTKSGLVAIDGSKQEIHMVVSFVGAEEYEAQRVECTQQSTQSSNENTIFLLAHDPGVEDLVDEIFRCERIFDQNRDRKTDKEVSDYLNGQRQRAQKLRRELERKLEKGMVDGSYIFRGQRTAVESQSSNLKQSTQAYLGTVAKEVYHKYDQASINPKTSLAETFLNADLQGVASEEDPLGLVQPNGRIDTSHDALRSILDYLEARGQVDGGQMQDHFSAAPYGWSKDALRYLVAALLAGSELKLRVGGDDVTARNATAVENLRSNRSFKRIGIALREQEVTPEQLERASSQLVELTGESVMPLEEEIGNTLEETFPDFRQDYASLPSQLRSHDLPGVERAEDLLVAVDELIHGSAADAVARLSAEESPLVNDLKWARQVREALDGNQVGESVDKANRFIKQIPGLPSVGAIRTLQEETKESRQRIQEILQRETFYNHVADLRTHLRAIEHRVEDTNEAVREEHEQSFATQRDELERKSEWSRMDAGDQDRLSRKLDELAFDIPPGLNGLRQFTKARIEIDDHLRRIEQEIEELGKQEDDSGDGPHHVVDFSERFSNIFSSAEDIDRVIAALEHLKGELQHYETVEIEW
jgi:hypothetical protein